ncbi:MAG: hypothetical protein E5W94_08765 [Mesorhizobium sp.]|nr:MAG: hypothetical protein E5W94_08765 [Mesorhizobium sp.]
MAIDVFELAKINQVAHRYMNQTLTQIENSIRSDFVYFRWAVPKDRIVVFRESLPIPPNIFEPGRQRMVTSYNLSEEQFRAITKLGADASGREGERSEEEGARRLRLHWAIERKPQLVAAFKASLTSFACSVCGFDFERTYKERGIGFIECHHTKPVAEIRPGEKTRLSDLRAVCSNCHQMLHRKPMLKGNKLNVHPLPTCRCRSARRHHAAA